MSGASLACAIAAIVTASLAVHECYQPSNLES